MMTSSEPAKLPSDRRGGYCAQTLIRISGEDLALVPRAERPDRLHVGAVLEELDRAVAHHGVGPAGMAAAHREHAGGGDIAAPVGAAVGVLGIRGQQAVAES